MNSFFGSLKFQSAPADREVMGCPKCRSTWLMIRQNKGLERLKIWLTGLREYVCRDCDTVFRAPDRRRVVREKKLEIAGLPRQAT